MVDRDNDALKIQVSLYSAFSDRHSNMDNIIPSLAVDDWGCSCLCTACSHALHNEVPMWLSIEVCMIGGSGMLMLAPCISLTECSVPQLSG